MTDKIASLVGFAVKANKVIYGLEELARGKRKRYLVMCSPTLSARSRDSALGVAKRDGVPIIETVGTTVEQLTHKRNCKIIGISDKQMSDAIIANVNQDYLLIKSEEI